MTTQTLHIIIAVSQVVTIVSVLVCCVCLWIVNRELRKWR